MEKTILVTVIIHVTAGFGALLFGAIAFALRKNTTKHKPMGRVYFWCMTIIFATGLFLSIVKELQFFFFIAIFSYYSTIIAYRALKLKELHSTQKPHVVDWCIQALAGLVFAGVFILGFYRYSTGGHGETIISWVFSGFGILGVYRNTKRLFTGPKETNYWLKTHAGNMMGSYIGGVTAFLVNQTDNIPLDPIFLWLGPSLIIAPVIVMELKKIKSEPLQL